MFRLLSRTAAAAAVVSFVAAMPAAALDILITNDDGFDSHGIEAVAAALKADGHKVTIVAPAGNRSGSSAAITTTPFTAEKKKKRVYAVDGTPATSAMFGLVKVLKKAPDLVISGINEGANLGTATVLSGTVGAATAAITQLENPVPAIAVSTNLVDSADPNSDANLAHYDDVAAFVAKLVTKLSGKGGKKGLRPGLGLNVNYPPLAPADIKGVKMAVQGRAPLFTWGFAEVGTDLYAINPSAPGNVQDVKASDTRWFNKGFVTIVPIDGDYTAAKAQRKRLSYLTKLKP